MSANPVRLAIQSHLKADAGVSALVGSRIYFQYAPQKATYPLVVFHKQSGRPRWTMQGDPVQSDLWTVKGVSRSDEGAATEAESIAAAIDAALNDASLTITGRECLFLLRESDVDYGEDADGTTYRHCGAMYRVESE